MATENLETNPYGPSPGQSRAARSSYYEDGLGTKQTVLVLIIVVGCFAVLWPNLLYPFLFSSPMKPGPADSGCCDVISELDVDTIKIMSELCSIIIDDSGQTPLTPKEIVSQCRKAVLETCGIDISAALQDRISLGQSVKQILEEVRSLNGSLCLKYNFGVSPWKLGVPHRVNINLDPANTIRQERPPHMHPGMVHPAFRERGRAIPETDDSRRKSKSPPRIVEGRPGPVPGMRAAMAGHQVAAPKQSTYGFMGVLMPMYTIGFVIFFSYTIMKLLITKKPDDYVGSPLYPPCDTDEQFQKEVFEANKHYFNRPNKDTSKIGDEELDQLRKRLRETELAMERIVSELAKGPLVATQVRSASNRNPMCFFDFVNAVAALLEEVNQEIEAHKNKTPSDSSNEQDEIRANGSLPKEEEQGSVTVMGMETTASSESGKKWSRADSPILPHPQPARPKEPSPPPQQIFLEGALPPQSQILVADSATEAQKDPEDNSPVVLAGKMTLSVINMDSEPGTDDSYNSGNKTESSREDRRRSSSNISEEFEKINAADLEDQINHIIEEAEQIALAEENRLSLNEELDKLPGELSNAFENNVVPAEENRYSLHDEPNGRTLEIPKAPTINEKQSEQNILEEIKNQFNLEDDLMRVLKEEKPEGKVSMPLTDIIKEFLNNEENILPSADDFTAIKTEDPDHDKQQAVNTEGKQEEIGEEPLSENKANENNAAEKEGEKLVENLQISEKTLNLEESSVESKINEQDLEIFKTAETSGEGRLEPFVSEEQIVSTQTEVTEGLSTTELPGSTEQFSKLEAFIESIPPKEQQHIGLIESQDVQKSETSEDGLSTTENLEPTKQFLKSETFIESVQAQEQKDIGPIESQDIQKLEISEDDLFTTENLEPTQEFLKSETSSDSFQAKEQKDIGLIESQDVQKLGISKGDLFTTENLEPTQQFLESETSIASFQAKEQKDIGPIESQDVQKLGISKEDLFTTENLEPTQEFLKSETSIDSVQVKEQKDIGLMESQDVQKIEVSEENFSHSVQAKEQQQILLGKQHVQELETKPLDITVRTEKTDEPIGSHEDAQNKETKLEKAKVENTLTQEKEIEDEAEPDEKAMTNKADLLLQGLVVKHAVETTDEGLLEAPEMSTSTTRSTPETDKNEDATSDINQSRPEEETNVAAEESPDLLDRAEQEIEDIEYQDESEGDSDEDELRGDEGIDYEDRESAERRVNGEEGDSSRNGAGNSETAAENEISEDDLENEDDEEIEEIIEYVDNTDEEGEEIIEINGNERRQFNEDGTH